MFKNFKTILFYFLLSLSILSCNNNCDQDCQGFDKNSEEFKWSPFQENIENITFENIRNKEQIVLRKNSYMISTKRFIESRCGNIFDTVSWGNSDVKSCQEEFYVRYSYEFNSTINSFLFHMSYTPKSISNKSYNISFDESDYFARFFLKNKEFMETAENRYSAVIDNNILKIENNSNTRNVNTLNSIWIEKSRGLIKFELDGDIWIRK